MTETTCQDWTDRARRVLNLHFANTEPMYRGLLEEVRDALRGCDDVDDATARVAEFLETDFSCRTTSLEGMIRNILPEPDFSEVARSWVNDEAEYQGRVAS